MTHSNTCGTTKPLPMPQKWYNYNAPKLPVSYFTPNPPPVKKPSKTKVGRPPPTLRPPTLIIQPQSFIPQNATSIFQNNQQSVLLRVRSVSIQSRGFWGTFPQTLVAFSLEKSLSLEFKFIFCEYSCEIFRFAKFYEPTFGIFLVKN